MNSITLAGNITRDAEVKFLPNGDPLASFGIADNQGKDKPAIFWNCSLFGKRAESLAQYLTKGQPVTIVGTITEREYTSKDGIKVKAMDVRVSDVALQGGRKDGGEQAAPAPRQAAPARRPAPAQEFDESDVPF